MLVHWNKLMLILGLVVLPAAAQTQPSPQPASEEQLLAYAASAQPFAADVPYLNTGDAAAANARRAAAQVQERQASRHLTAEISRLKGQVRRSPDARRARVELAQAQDQYESARQTSLERLRDEDERYRDAVDARDRLAYVLRAGQLSRKDRLEVASRKLTIATLASRLEGAHLSSDTGVERARQNMIDAADRLNRTHDELAERVRTDSQLVDLRRQLEAAQVAAAAERAYLAGLDAGQNRNEQAYRFYNRHGRAYYPPIVVTPDYDVRYYGR